MRCRRLLGAQEPEGVAAGVRLQAPDQGIGAALNRIDPPVEVEPERMHHRLGIDRWRRIRERSCPFGSALGTRRNRQPGRLTYYGHQTFTAFHPTHP